MKMKWFITGVAVASLCLTGCTNNDNAGDNNDNGTQFTQNTRNNNNARPMYVKNNTRNNQNVKTSRAAEREVEKLKEVEDAHVLITNNNAYVAVRLSKNNRGNTNNQGTTNVNFDNNGNATRNGALDGDGNTFMENGRVNPDNNNNNTDDGTINGNDDAGNKNDRTQTGRNAGTFAGDNNRQNAGIGFNGNRTGQNLGTGTGGNSTGQDVGPANNTGQNGGTGIGGNRAGQNVGTGIGGNTTGQNMGTQNGETTNRNGANNNANNTAQYSPVSNAFEQKIADAVRRADDRISRVYVSANPDFYDRVNTFANDMRTNNNNNDGLFDRFNDIVDDFFGTANNDRTNTR